MGRKFALLFILLAVQLTIAAESTVLNAYDEALNLMSKHYFDPSFSGLNWQDETEKTREKIINATEDEEKYKYILELFANLKHSHLVFEPASLNDEKKTIPTGPPKNIDFNVEAIGNSWLVTSVKNNSAAQQAGLKMGMQIIKLNDWSLSEYFDTESAMDYYMLRNALHFYPEDEMSITVLDKEQETKSITIKLKKFSGKYQKMGLIRDPSEFEEKILPGNIGYVRFSIFLVKRVQQAIAAIKKMRDLQVNGIIVDVRNNPGGVAMLSTAVAKEFCSKNYNLGIQTGRDMTLKFPVFAQPKPFKGKVIFLQNKNSASTSEVLAAGMQANKSITVVGDTSAGMALPSVMVSLKDGSVFQYPIADFKTVNDKTIEGVGVIPDINVSHTLESLSQKKDIYIETAIKIINQED